MVDHNDKEPKRSAAARKVGSNAEPTAGPDGARRTTADGRGAGRPLRRIPFWRRGSFWVAVIAAEVALALVISFSFERSPTDVDLAGGDLPAFCAEVEALRETQAAASAGSDTVSVGDPSRFEQERAAYLALIPLAPPDLVPDLEHLAELDAELADTARAIGADKATDPSVSGLAELTAALERASSEGRVAASRVDVVLLEGCGISGPPGVPTTTAPPTVAVPGTSGR